MRNVLPAIIVAFLLGSGLARAAQGLVTEIYTVGFRPVDEIVALVRPLVPPPGTVVAYHDKLVVKASEATHADVTRLLSEVDRAPVNLLVSVRHTLTAQVQRDVGQVFARIEGDDAGVFVGREPEPGSSGLRVRVGDEDTAAGGRVVRTLRDGDDRDVQSVRLLEGQEAFVRTGVAVPTGERHLRIYGIGVGDWRGIRYRYATKGFFVRPRITPDGVAVDIRTHRNTVSRSGGGVFDLRSSATTVSGALGRWMQVAGVEEVTGRSAEGYARSTRSQDSSDYAVYLKVDRLPE